MRTQEEIYHPCSNNPNAPPPWPCAWARALAPTSPDKALIKPL
jgi:hypothetical protein